MVFIPIVGKACDGVVEVDVAKKASKRRLLARYWRVGDRCERMRLDTVGGFRKDCGSGK